MPVYEYTNADGTQTVLLRRPVDQRDAPVLHAGVRLRRRAIPTRLTVGTGAKPESMGSRLARGYKALEAQGGFDDRHPNYLPEKTIKRVLAEPDPAEPITP
jgi:hypothetical protein